ncbi:hypothetical protein [Glaciecola sp. SC05]|uniref:hypothetical protein n=1 Tax=Glaciecola sp. SC05 TaxID=1987355 RepID=UPI0035288F41
MKLILTISLLIYVFWVPATNAANGAKHYPGIFVGSTKFDGETNFTLGLEYEYRVSNKWGIGGALERINEGHEGDGVSIWTVMGFYHPVEHIKLGFGPGQERIGGDYGKNKDLLRFAIAYEYPVNDAFEIAPTIDIDLIDGDIAFVAGVAFILMF